MFFLFCAAVSLKAITQADVDQCDKVAVKVKSLSWAEAQRAGPEVQMVMSVT